MKERSLLVKIVAINAITASDRFVAKLNLSKLICFIFYASGKAINVVLLFTNIYSTALGACFRYCSLLIYGMILIK